MIVHYKAHNFTSAIFNVVVFILSHKYSPISPIFRMKMLNDHIIFNSVDTRIEFTDSYSNSGYMDCCRVFALQMLLH